MTAFWVIAVIAAAVALLLAVPLSMRVFIFYDVNDRYAGLTFRILGINIHKPKRKTNKQKEETHQKEPETKSAGKTEEILSFARNNIEEIKDLVYDILGYMYKHLIRIKKLKLHLIIGTDDAMDTALIYGAVAAFVFNAVGVMDRHMRLISHDINIKPDFKKPNIFVEFEAIISTNIFHLIVLFIIAAVRGLKLLKKYKSETAV